MQAAFFCRACFGLPAPLESSRQCVRHSPPVEISCLLGMNDNIPAAKRREYALGYLALGLVSEALAEITALSADELDSAYTQSVLIDIHMATRAWGLTVDIAREYAQRCPREEKGWISWAYALRELERVEDARDVLLKAEPLHGAACALLHYNLACYFCLLKEMPEARRRLALAFTMDTSFVEEAKTDCDLKGLV